MRDFPEAVSTTFENLKKEYPFYIILLAINGHYYVYRHRGVYQKETGKIKTLRTYLGRITETGEFFKRGASVNDDIERAKAIIESHGGKIIMPDADKSNFLSIEKSDNSKLDVKILEALSTDARQGISKISKSLGIPYSTTLNRVKKLEEKYGIRYTIEYGFLDRFSLYRYLAIAKFTDTLPDTEEVKKLISAESKIQLALWTKGEYNLFLFILASTPKEVEDLIYKLRSNHVFSKYPADWYCSYFTWGHGYIPLRDEFFDLIKDRVWHRTKQTPRKQSGQIFKREYSVMKALNSNGLIDFKEIDKNYNLTVGSARSTYHDLIKTESIWRVTLTMQNPPLRNIVVINIEQTDIERFNKNRRAFLLNQIEENYKLLNNYLYVSDIGAPYGIMMIAPLYKEGDLERLESTLSSIIKGSKIRISVVSSTLVGQLGFRKVDSTKTLWYRNVKGIIT